MCPSRPEVCLLVVFSALCGAPTLASADDTAEVSITMARMDPDTPTCQAGAPLEGSPEDMLRFLNDCPIGERDLEALRDTHREVLATLRDEVGERTGELIDLIVSLQSMRHRANHVMFSDTPRPSVQKAVARFYSVVEFNEASLSINDLSLIRTALQRLLELEVSPEQTPLGRQMMGRVRFVIERATARCGQHLDASRPRRARRKHSELAHLCDDLEVYGELAAGFTGLRAMLAYWNGYTAIAHWSRWKDDAPMRVAEDLRQKATLGVRIAAEEPARGGRDRLLRASGVLLALSATTQDLAEVERTRQRAFRMWSHIPRGARSTFAPYVRFVLLARVRLGLDLSQGEQALIEANHLLNEALTLGDGLLLGVSENPFPGALVAWPLIEREIRITSIAIAVSRHANALPGRDHRVRSGAIMLGAARTLAHFFARERLEAPMRDDAIALMVEALRHNRLGDLAVAFGDHHQAPTREHTFQVPSAVLEEIDKVEAALGDYARAAPQDKARHLDGLTPLYEPLHRQLWFLQAIPDSGADRQMKRLRQMMPPEVLQSASLFQAGRRPHGPPKARDMLRSTSGAWVGTRLDPVRGDYDLVPVPTEDRP